MLSSPEQHRAVRFDSCELADAARSRLHKSPYFSIRRVACQCDQRRLTLTGRLTSYFEKQLAQEAVARVEGVEEIVNAIEVVNHAADPHPAIS